MPSILLCVVIVSCSSVGDAHMLGTRLPIWFSSANREVSGSLGERFFRFSVTVPDINRYMHNIGTAPRFVSNSELTTSVCSLLAKSVISALRIPPINSEHSQASCAVMPIINNRTRGKRLVLSFWKRLYIMAAA